MLMTATLIPGKWWNR